MRETKLTDTVRKTLPGNSWTVSGAKHTIGADFVGLGPIPIFSSGAHPAKNSQIILVSRISCPTMGVNAPPKQKQKNERLWLRPDPTGRAYEATRSLQRVESLERQASARSLTFSAPIECFDQDDPPIISVAIIGAIVTNTICLRQTCCISQCAKYRKSGIFGYPWEQNPWTDRHETFTFAIHPFNLLAKGTIKHHKCTQEDTDAYVTYSCPIIHANSQYNVSFQKRSKSNNLNSTTRVNVTSVE